MKSSYASSNDDQKRSERTVNPVDIKNVLNQADAALASATQFFKGTEEKAAQSSTGAGSGIAADTPRSKSSLDLRNNDNSFIVIASLVVDRFADRLNLDSFVVTADDRAHLDRMVTDAVRTNLVDAVKFRLPACPKDSNKQIHIVLRKSATLGLNLDGSGNVLFAAANSVFKVSKQYISMLTDNSTAVSATDGSFATSDDPESLARRQLMAELREASNLMAESVTPEAARFWRNHVVELQARLRALHGESSSVQMGPPPPPPTQTQTVERSEPHETAEEVMKANEAGMKALKRDLSELNIKSGYVPPTSVSASGSMQEPVPKNDCPTPNSNVTMDPKLEGVPMVDVVSPADLPGGYMFEAEVDDRRFIAVVPQGGVRRGETFSCHMRDLESIGSDIPIGRWRDGLFDCTANGIFHPLFLNSLFCPLLALGQILTRMGFDFLGRPASPGKTNEASWTMMVSFTVFWVLVNLGIFGGFNYKWHRGLELSTADLSAVLFFNVFMLGLTVIVTTAARGSIREKYLIREKNLYDFEDCCCALFCTPCTICQIGRHSAVFDRDEAACCSSTGLGDETPQTQANDGRYMV